MPMHPSLLQVESLREGVELQTYGGTYMISPQRDIANLYPELCRKAFQFIEAYSETDSFLKYINLSEEKLQALAKFAAQLIALPSLPKNYEVPVNELAKQAGWYELDNNSKAVFTYALGMITMSAYVQGMKEANISKKFKPFVFAGPEDIWEEPKEDATNQ